jgi:hypothetical protein
MDIQAYQQMMAALDLSRDEKLMILEKREKQCICPQCPNYKECTTEENELAFCSTGKSVCIEKEKQCICSTCPLAAELGLKNTFYCTRGSEKQQVLLETLQVRKSWVK